MPDFIQSRSLYFLAKRVQMLQIFNKAVLKPRVLPAFAITYYCNHCNIRFESTSKYVDTLTLFSKNLNQRSLTPRWPLTPCLLRSHVWLYPRIIVSKSHENTSMYMDTVINFAKYHIHKHTTYIHTTYYVQNEWSHSLLLNSVQARQKLTPALQSLWLQPWSSMISHGNLPSNHNLFHMRQNIYCHEITFPHTQPSKWLLQ